MVKTVDILDIAKCFVLHFNHFGEPITNKKLQKMLYYAQSWHLVYFDKHPLFSETPEAWVHGPVYPNVYKRYKGFQAKPLHFNAGCTREELDHCFTSLGLTTEQNDFLQSIILHYGSKSAFELEILSHREQPWLEAREGLDDFDISSNPISLETMHSYYSSLYNKRNS